MRLNKKGKGLDKAEGKGNRIGKGARIIKVGTKGKASKRKN